jgi:1,4-dihydroxy-2-naphthoyl-CoA synthase
VLRGLALGAPYSIERLMSLMVLSTEDAREGPKAFMEKRAPI